MCKLLIGQTDLSDDLYIALVCEGGSRHTAGRYTGRSSALWGTQEGTPETSTCCSPSQDGRPSDPSVDCLCSCAGAPHSSPISPAHTFIKLHFALCDATQWASHYNGFNYEEFYEFIIDFFEADQSPEGKAAASELCKWWNRCVRDVPPAFAVADMSPGKCFRGLPQHGESRLSQHDSRRLQFYENNAELACPASLPSSH